MRGHPMIRLSARTLIRVNAGRPPGRTEYVRMGKKKAVVHSAHFRLYCFQSYLDMKPPPTTDVERTKRLSASRVSAPTHAVGMSRARTKRERGN